MVTLVYVQVLGQPGEPLVVDNKDPYSALDLCKHMFCLHVSFTETLQTSVASTQQIYLAMTHRRC